jgi:DNA-binding transcriptional LysR family regulator
MLNFIYMTLDQLQTLQQIVESGSLKQAALRLHKTQPALSMAIKKLENEYGFRILNRNSYRLSLTSAGKTFYLKSQEVLLNAAQLSSMGKHLGSGNEAQLRFAYDSTCPTPLIFNVLKQCQLQFPDTQLDVYGESRFGALTMLQNKQADLALSPWWPTFYGLGDFATLTVSQFKVIIAATPELFNHVAVQSVEQLKTKVQLVVEESELHFDNENLLPVKGATQWRTRDALTLKHLLIGGLGWGHVPEHLVQQELHSGTLIALHPQDIEHSIDGEIRLVRRVNTTLGPVASMIWDAFAAVNIAR